MIKVSSKRIGPEGYRAGSIFWSDAHTHTHCIAGAVAGKWKVIPQFRFLGLDPRTHTHTHTHILIILLGLWLRNEKWYPNFNVLVSILLSAVNVCSWESNLWKVIINWYRLCEFSSAYFSLVRISYLKFVKYQPFYTKSHPYFGVYFRRQLFLF